MKFYNIKWNIAFLLTFLFIEILGTSYLTTWRNLFWSAIEKKNFEAFLILLGIFTVVALILCFIGGMQSYIISRVSMEWRRRKTRKVLPGVYDINHVEGYKQRIQADLFDYPNLKLMLYQRYLYSSIMALFYAGMIIYYVGILYLIIPFLYAAISTIIGRSIAKPLIDLNYKNQASEASFRENLLRSSYAVVNRVSFNLFKKTKHFTYFQVFYNQISVIFPFLLLSGLYFYGSITFGVLMMLAATISQLVDSFGVFINNYAIINKYLSCKKRLKEIGAI